MMPNRHAPHSHVSPAPKEAKPCYHCDKPILLQAKRVTHACSEACHPHGVTHDYSHETLQPIVRYFDDHEGMREMCRECFDKPEHKRRKHVAAEQE